jgi:hypothetical protein
VEFAPSSVFRMTKELWRQHGEFSDPGPLPLDSSRTKRLNPSGETLNRLLHLNNEMLTNMPGLPFDMIVYRDINYGKTIVGDRMKAYDSFPGVVTSIYSFTSTSLECGGGLTYSGPTAPGLIFLEIHLPKGFPGLIVSAKDGEESNFGEKEVLLPATLDKLGETMNYGFKRIGAKSKEDSKCGRKLIIVEPVLLQTPIPINRKRLTT